jgi:hypothetical protein
LEIERMWLATLTDFLSNIYMASSNMKRFKS